MNETTRDEKIKDAVRQSYGSIARRFTEEPEQGIRPARAGGTPDQSSCCGPRQAVTIRQSARGQALRHPFTGVAVALECGVPDEVCHIIAAHAGEGDMIRRSTEAIIVHHADFMSYLPFHNLGA